MNKIEKHINYKVKILELFGGIGAPRIALDNVLGAGVRTIDYVDVLNWAVFAYNKLNNNDYLPQSVKEWNNDVDILIHGSPCQDLSNAGKKLGAEIGSGTRSSLLWETLDIIETRLNKLPKCIIWENVPSVLNKRNIHIFTSYLNSLEQLGYKNNWQVIDARDCGIPQARKRLFVVSVLPNSEYSHFDFAKLEYKQQYEHLFKFLEVMDEEQKRKYILTQPSMMKAIKNGKIKILNDYCQTITTKQMRWNNAGVIQVGITDPKFRILTERECWRLMGFTDAHFDKIKELPSSALYHLAGNSIVIPVLETIFKELFRNEI